MGAETGIVLNCTRIMMTAVFSDGTSTTIDIPSPLEVRTDVLNNGAHAEPGDYYLLCSPTERIYTIKIKVPPGSVVLTRDV